MEGERDRSRETLCEGSGGSDEHDGPQNAKKKVLTAQLFPEQRWHPCAAMHP